MFLIPDFVNINSLMAILDDNRETFESIELILV